MEKEELPNFVENKRDELIKKLERNYYMGDGEYTDCGIVGNFVDLFDRKSLAIEIIEQYKQIINCVFTQYIENPEFANIINKALPEGFNLNVIDVKLNRLNEFFKTFKKYDSQLGCIEFQRLIDSSRYNFTSIELDMIADDYLK